jgi:hypothetical protein
MLAQCSVASLIWIKPSAGVVALQAWQARERNGFTAGQRIDGGCAPAKALGRLTRNGVAPLNRRRVRTPR